MKNKSGSPEAIVKFRKGAVDIKFKMYHKAIGDYYAVAIPVFNMFFTAKNQEEMESKANAMFYSYCEYFDKVAKFEDFFEDLINKGFKFKKNHLTIRYKFHKQKISPKGDMIISRSEVNTPINLKEYDSTDKSYSRKVA